MIFNDAELLAIIDNLEKDFRVARIVAPSPGIGSPEDAIAFYPASIGPGEIVYRPDVGQEQDAVRGQTYLHHLRIATRD